jgi:hypothetical protein
MQCASSTVDAWYSCFVLDVGCSNTGSVAVCHAATFACYCTEYSVRHQFALALARLNSAGTAGLRWLDQ